VRDRGIKESNGDVTSGPDHPLAAEIVIPPFLATGKVYIRLKRYEKDRKCPENMKRKTLSLSW
jgi:hypothetical protein